MTKAHAICSPSTADRWWVCAGSNNAIEAADLPPEIPHPSAVEGTEAHELFEVMLRAVIAKRKVSPHTLDLFEDDTMRAHIADVVDYVLTFLKKNAILLSEARVEIRAIDDTGTLDAAILIEKDGIIHIFDLKYGSREVRAEHNKQMQLYLTSFLRFKWAKRFVLHICQPKVNSENYDENKWEITRRDLEAFEKDAEARVKATRDPNAPLTAGEKQCRWCPLAGSCKTHAEYATEMAAKDFKEFLTPSKPLIPYGSLSNAEISIAVERLGTLQSWMTALKAEAASRIVTGKNDGLDLKMVEGRSHRRWTDPDDVIELMTSKGYKPDSIAPRKLAGLGEITSLLRLKGEPKKAVDKFLDKFTNKPHGKPILAHVNDKRPAIPQRDAKQAFAEFITGSDDE